MNKLLCIALTLLSINGLAQEWTFVKMDDNLSVHVPDNFEMFDTLGQNLIKAQLVDGFILIQRLSNQGEGATVINDKDDLIKSYKGFQRGMIESQKGKLLTQQWIERNELHMNQFSYSAKLNEVDYVRHCIVLFLNGYWYTIQFWMTDPESKELLAQRDKLFSSIELPLVSQPDSQYDHPVEGSPGYKAGYLLGKMIAVILVAGFVALIIILLSKATRRKRANPSERQ